MKTLIDLTEMLMMLAKHPGCKFHGKDSLEICVDCGISVCCSACNQECFCYDDE